MIGLFGVRRQATGELEGRRTTDGPPDKQRRGGHCPVGFVCLWL